MEGADLAGTSLIGVDLSKAKMAGARFTRGVEDLALDVQNVLISHKEWADFAGAKGARAVLDGRDLKHVNFPGIDLAGATLREIDLRGGNLSEAGLVMADLTNARLDKASLVNADLSGANLKGARRSRGGPDGV